jgi:hypothetical protein
MSPEEAKSYGIIDKIISKQGWSTHWSTHACLISKTLLY